MTAAVDRTAWVGPVLQPGKLTELVIAALRDDNPELEVIDRGGYLRVMAPRRCVLRCATVEHHRGAAFRMFGDLEAIMSSFKGRLRISEEEASWESGPRGSRP